MKWENIYPYRKRKQRQLIAKLQLFERTDQKLDIKLETDRPCSGHEPVLPSPYIQI